MNPKILNNRSNAFPGFICLAVFIIIFLFGLWPLNFYPKNEVRWLPDKNGISFNGHGVVFNPEPFNVQKKAFFKDDSITIEILLQPEKKPNRYLTPFFSIYDDKGNEYFTFSQWKSYLEITSSKIINTKKRESNYEIGLRNALPAGKKSFLSIVSGKEGTIIYINGRPARSYPNYSLFSGKKVTPWQLILGNPVTGKYRWIGNIFGIALYNQSLRAEQVIRHYQTWVQNGSPTASEEEGLVALYLFDEHSGSLAHDSSGNRNRLIIPSTFHILKKSILVPPWRAFRFNLRDIFINVAGFIPLGFFYSLYFLDTKQFSIRRTYLIAIIFGAGISLTIELLQVYLPTRSSSLTDLICNILGTILGVIIFHRGLMFLGHHRQVK